MATIAVSANPVLFKIGDGGGSEVFTTIAEVMSVSGLGVSVANVDVTSFDSAGWEEFISTLKSIGDITLKLNFNNHATQGFATGLYVDALNKTKRNFQVVLPTTSNKTASFAALVQDFKFDDLTPAGAIQATVTLKGSGAIAWA